MQNYQANPRPRRRSNLGRRLSTLVLESKPQPSFPSFNTALSRRTTSGLGLLKSAKKKTPTQLITPSIELSTRKRLFQQKTPPDFNSSRYSPIQGSSSNCTLSYGSSSGASAQSDFNLDITGVYSISSDPSPSCSSANSSSFETRPKCQFDILVPPKSPVLSYKYTLSKYNTTNLKPPVDPDDLITCSESSNLTTCTLTNSTSDLNSLKISPGESKSISSSENSCKYTFSKYDTTNLKPPVDPVALVTCSESSNLNRCSLTNFTSDINSLKISPGESKSISLSENQVNSQETIFKKPEPILPPLKSSEKLSVVHEDESESADDSFILTEQTLIENYDLTNDGVKDIKMPDLRSDGVIMPCDLNSPNLTIGGLKNCDSVINNSALKDSNSLEYDEDIDDVLTHLENILERSKENKKQQNIMEEGLKKMKKQQILMEKEMSQLKQAVLRLKNKKKGKQQENVENKENVNSESSTKTKDAWIKKMKAENPSLLKTPKIRRNSRLSIADQSTTWTPHSLSNMVNGQMNDLFN